MIAARIAVRYDDDWTADSVQFGVFGKFIAYSFRRNQYTALLTLSADDLDGACDLIRSHEDITEVSVVRRTDTEAQRRESATLTVKSKYYTIPPMEMLSYEGYLPTGYPSIEDGRIHFDLVLENREHITHAKTLLEHYGDARVVYLSERLMYQTAPTLDEFEELIESLTPRQLEILLLAAERGYFERPRAVTIQSLADELGLSKTTASDHLRRSMRKVLEFANRQLSLPETRQDS